MIQVDGCFKNYSDFCDCKKCEISTEKKNNLCKNMPKKNVISNQDSNPVLVKSNPIQYDWSESR